MNFLKFRDFSKNNLKFSRFILNLFIFEIIKIFYIIYRADMALSLRVDTWQRMHAPRVA